MPIYEYLCEKCGNRFEQMQKMSDEPLTECPTCKGDVRRVIPTVSVQYPSSWYVKR
ncbi:MAG: zinc ribbon domain-containing protein [Chloroflexi bacterium]|nr:zinc ribbon domain-containing protein [Chloroflexota bacterium]